MDAGGSFQKSQGWGGGGGGGGGGQTALSTWAQLCAPSVTMKGGMEGDGGWCAAQLFGWLARVEGMEKANK